MNDRSDANDIPSFLQELFEEISNDRSRGSRDLTALLLEELLLEVIEQPNFSEVDIRSVCREITRLRPEMTSVCTLGYLLWSEYQQLSGDKPPEKRLETALRTLRSRHELANQKIAQHHRELSPDDHDVMTFSRSSTVLALLERIDSIEKVLVLHSHPGEEGIDLADDLVDKLDVTFAYDVEAGYFLPRVDALYVGVDALMSDGSIVNKTGTRLLARSAQQTPVRAFTDVWKLTDVNAVTDAPRLSSPDGLPDQLQRQHPLFETIPSKHIDTYITDRGWFSSAEQLTANLEDVKSAQRDLKSAPGDNN